MNLDEIYYNMEQEIARLRRERDEAREALRDILEFFTAGGEEGKTWPEVYDKAREVLGDE